MVYCEGELVGLQQNKPASTQHTHHDICHQFSVGRFFPIPRLSFISKSHVHHEKFLCTKYEKSKVTTDKIELQATSEGVPITIVYPGVIYGPGKVTAGNVVTNMVKNHGLSIFLLKAGMLGTLQALWEVFPLFTNTGWGENSTIGFLDKHMRASFETSPQPWVTNISAVDIHSGN